MENPRCRGLNLQSFLIKPLQRLTKYPLLLTELSKNTPDTLSDRVTLQKALGKIIVVVNRINSAKSKSDQESEEDQLKRSRIEALITNAEEKQVTFSFHLFFELNNS